LIALCRGKYCTPDTVSDWKLEKFACGEASININNMAKLKSMVWEEHVEMLAILWKTNKI